MRVFLDTNIVLDLLDSKRAFHAHSIKLIESLIESDCEIVISEDMLTTIFYISKKRDEVLSFIETIIDEWSIKPFGKELIAEGVQICKDNSTHDLEDVLQSLLAQKQNCSILYTNDKNFYKSSLETRTSKDF